MEGDSEPFSREEIFRMLPFVLKGGRREPDLTQSDFSLLEGLSCRHKVSLLWQSKRSTGGWEKGERERESRPEMKLQSATTNVRRH